MRTALIPLLIVLLCVWYDRNVVGPEQSNSKAFQEPPYITVYEKVTTVLEDVYEEDGKVRVTKVRIEYVPKTIPNPRAKK